MECQIQAARLLPLLVIYLSLLLLLCSLRIGFLNIPVWEIALTLAILLATICMMIGLTSRVYRGGVLLYGKGAFSNIKKAIKLGKK